MRLFGNHLRRNAVAYLALFVAFGGTGYAAVTLPRNSVGTTQLKNGAVTAAKVKAASLLARDFKPGQLPAGPAGSPGAVGPVGPQGASRDKGAPGSALGFAHILVNAGGATVDASRSSNVAQTNVSHPSTGVVCFSGLPFTPHSIVANGDAASGVLVVAITALAPDAAVLGACGGTGQAALATETVGSSPSNVDQNVYVVFN